MNQNSKFAQKNATQILESPKNMKKTIMIMAVVLFVYTTVEARLGETVAQIEARYGQSLGTLKGIPPANPTLYYKKNNYSIQVGFLNGKSAYEIYLRQDHNNMALNEIESFLALNGNGKKWKDISTSAVVGDKWWGTEKAEFGAMYMHETSSLMLYTGEFDEARNRLQKKDVEKSIDGF